MRLRDNSFSRFHRVRSYNEGAFRSQNEVFIQHRTVSADTSMRSLLVIIFQPHAKDVIELSSTETNEVIQHFPFCSSDEA